MNRRLWVEAGRLGRFALEPGCYVYLGSARRNLAQRVARHRRLAESRQGRLHWHVDRLLIHRYARLVAGEPIPGADECTLVRALIATGAAVPIPHFGATDCRTGCPAHLLRLP